MEEGFRPQDGSGWGAGRPRALGWLRAGTIEGLGMAQAGTAEGLRPWDGSGWGTGRPQDGLGWDGGGPRASGWLGLGKGRAGARDCVGFLLGLHCWQRASGWLGARMLEGLGPRDGSGWDGGGSRDGSGWGGGGSRDGSGWARAEWEPGTVWDSRWACIAGAWFLTSPVPPLGQVLPYETSPGVGQGDEEISPKLEQ